MLPKKNRLATAIAARQKALEMTDRAVGEKYGWRPQTYNTWKAGHVPGPSFRDALAEFLDIPRAELDGLCEAAKETGGTAPKGALGYVQDKGRISDRKTGRFKFAAVNVGFGPNYIPYGRYAVRVDTNAMEPVFLYGCRVWADSNHWAKPGHDVFVHASRGAAWIGRLVALDGVKARIEQYNRPEPIEIDGVEAVHVIVLAERILGG